MLLPLALSLAGFGSTELHAENWPPTSRAGDSLRRSVSRRNPSNLPSLPSIPIDDDATQCLPSPLGADPSHSDWRRARRTPPSVSCEQSDKAITGTTATVWGSSLAAFPVHWTRFCEQTLLYWARSAACDHRPVPWMHERTGRSSLTRENFHGVPPQTLSECWNLNSTNAVGFSTAARTTADLLPENGSVSSAAASLSQITNNPDLPLLRAR
jgi:hypothetical protein